MAGDAYEAESPLGELLLECEEPTLPQALERMGTLQAQYAPRVR